MEVEDWKASSPPKSGVDLTIGGAPPSPSSVETQIYRKLEN